MAKKATVDKLNGLHALVATYYGTTLEEALEEGVELSSGTLNAINAFLKANDITVEVSESKPMENLSFTIAKLIDKEKEEITA